MSTEEEAERRSDMAKAVFLRHKARAGGEYYRPRPVDAKKRPRNEGERVPVEEANGETNSSTGGPEESSAKAQTQPRAWVPPPGTYRSKNGTGPSRWDPQNIGSIIQSETEKRGWEHTLAVASVSADWEQIVGPQVAAHCPIASFEGGVLIAQADSTAWAQQLRLLLPHIQRRIDERVGAGIVEKVVVKAPQAPSWVHGARHIPGRGPRDTYG